MKLLLAGPGTGKTTRIKKIIDEQYADSQKILVLSFTNATVNELSMKFSSNDNVSCSTLHSFALRNNHLPELHILIQQEKKIIESISKRTNIDYSTFCRILKCIDFDSMIIECVAFIKTNPVYFEEKIGSLDLLIVDEFQDFNPMEQEFVMLLSQYATDTIIMGDDDQSIYGFKDADPNGIISLFNEESIEKMYHENICYRCPDSVVDASKKLISNNKRRIDKEWKKYGKAGFVTLQQGTDDDSTTDIVESLILEIREKDPEGSILILSPVGFAVKSIRERLSKSEIEIVDFWNDAIKEESLIEIWWLNLILGDNKLLFSILLLFAYKLCDARTIKIIKDRLMDEFDETKVVNELLDRKKLPTELWSKIFVNTTFEEIKEIDHRYDKYSEYINEDYLKQSVKNLIKTISKPKEFERGKVNLMSIHKSKGLESDYVIINGLVNGILPNVQKGIDTIEAQRRLLFVGMTRAKKGLVLVSTVRWLGEEAHKVDFSQFRYDRVSRKYKARTSKYIDEIVK